MQDCHHNVINYHVCFFIPTARSMGDKELTRGRVIHILNRANPDLRKYLNLDEDLLVSLRGTDPQVLSDEEKDRLSDISVQSQRIDELVKLLKRNPTDVYLAFMEALLIKDEDLHEHIKSIQDQIDDAAADNLKAASNIPVQGQGIDEVVALLKTKGWDVYLAFMEALRNKDEDLHENIQEHPDNLMADSNIQGPDEVPLNTSSMWQPNGHFSTAPDLEAPHGIAIHSNGDAAVTRREKPSDIKIFSKDGKIKPSLFAANGRSFDKPAGTKNVTDIAMDPTKARHYVSGDGKILKYDATGKRIKPLLITKRQINVPFRTLISDGERSHPITVASDKTGKIIAGLEGSTISIHKKSGHLIRKFKIPAVPRSLDVCTSKEEIAVVFVNNSLQIFDYQGTSLKKIPPPDGVLWSPWTVCCSNQEPEDIFVVNRRDGCVYRYCGDKRAECIISGLDQPYGIAINETDTELYITEPATNMVKIFKRPSDD